MGLEILFSKSLCGSRAKKSKVHMVLYVTCIRASGFSVKRLGSSSIHKQLTPESTAILQQYYSCNTFLKSADTSLVAQLFDHFVRDSAFGNPLLLK